jgi:hypothetical protein
MNFSNTNTNEPEQVLMNGTKDIAKSSDAANGYDQKQELKAERYLELADKCEKEADRLDATNKSIADCMNGTPILVGHYSENRHRRELRMRSRTDKAMNLRDQANEYRKKAENRKNPTFVSSDDPEAIQKLKTEIAELEIEYKKWKESKSDESIDWFKEGSPRYRTLQLESIGRKLRDRKKRIEDLRAVQSLEGIDKTVNNVTGLHRQGRKQIEDCLSWQTIYTEIITELKRNGFRWSPRNQTWQRMIGNHAIYLAEKIRGMVA